MATSLDVCQRMNSEKEIVNDRCPARGVTEKEKCEGKKKQGVRHVQGPPTGWLGINRNVTRLKRNGGGRDETKGLS